MKKPPSWFTASSSSLFVLLIHQRVRTKAALHDADGVCAKLERERAAREQAEQALREIAAVDHRETGLADAYVACLRIARATLALPKTAD